MAVDNNSLIDNQTKLDSLLRHQVSGDSASISYRRAVEYAESIAAVENCIAVVSNLTDNTSRIIAGRFSDMIGLGDYGKEDSIWEKKIFSLMSPEEQQEKFIAELRFFHYLKNVVPSKRDEYCLYSKLRMLMDERRHIDVLHRMYYVYDNAKTSIIAAICLYSPLIFDFNGKSYVVNTVTGLYEELTHSADSAVLSRRERQVLALIDSGMNSRDIAERLNISVHTVNRHRQSILENLNAKNYHEACRTAKSMSII